MSEWLIILGATLIGGGLLAGCTFLTWVFYKMVINPDEMTDEEQAKMADFLKRRQ